MALPARVSVSRLRTTRVLLVGPYLGAAFALLAGAAGGITPRVALALSTMPVAALVADRLIRLARGIHARERVIGPCRGAGFLGLGSVAVGLDGLGVSLAPAHAQAAVAGAGLLCAAGVSLLGLTLLPGVATRLSERLRRGLDGLSIGITLAFTFWLLLRPGTVPPFALGEGLLAAAALAACTVLAWRAAAYRRAALLCGAGVGTMVSGLTGLAVPLAYGVTGRWLLVGSGVAVVGLALIEAGARRAGVMPTPPAPGATALAGYPLLTVPIGAALVMAFYHLVAVRTFDRTAMALGLASALTLVVREALSAADIRRYASRLAGREAHFRSLVAGASDVILVVDEDLMVRWQSPAAARLFGLSDQDVVGRTLLSLLHPDDADVVGRSLIKVIERHRDASRSPLLAARLCDGFGQWRDTESTVSDQRDVPDVGALVVHLRDVGERRRLEQTLREMSRTDPLTSLPNRRELLRGLAVRRDATGSEGVFLVVDLHGLTAVNDERGREIGDAVLVEVARRLSVTLGPDDTVGRLGGDEFGVVTAAGPVLAYALGVRLLAALTRPYHLPSAVVILHASIGLAETGAGAGVDDVVQHADLACRRARQLGRDRLEWYDTDLEEQFARRLDMERELAGAIARAELDLVFQPVVHLLDRRPVGVEALLRWRHPRLGTMLPAEVLPVADDIGITGEIARWVLRTVCRHLSGWLAADLDLWVSVNMSHSQLVAPEFVAHVETTLATHRLAPERLVVEVPEDGLGDDVATMLARLSALRVLGVRTALDNFGAGQASLAQLRRLPIDFLKVDGALVSQPGNRSGPTRPVIDVVVGLARRLGLEPIVEGLESRTRLDEAIKAGCRLGQGFLLARPMPAEHLEAYLADYRARSL